ncbi:prepilin-type N-terminal cleavage/methylation domain-containing protein [Candidatus Gracilibacteria bacterium]|nr:prepilin-type N-terminal cleavage/methylation domain-containing protein [Candidatus Gracilibacteria bacterium]
MLYNKKGFSLAELMIVVALIGLFFAATSYMNRDVRVYQNKAERFAGYIYDQIRTARNNMVIGRGVLSGGTISIVATSRKISISNTGITSIYEHPTGTGMEAELLPPFFESDPLYIISDIAISSGGMTNVGTIPAWDQTGATSADIILSGTGIRLFVSGAINPIRTLMITTGYAGFKRSVLVDRVTGTVEIKVSGETNQ